MKALFIATHPVQAENNWVEYPTAVLRHEPESVAGHVLSGLSQGAVIIPRLTYNIPKSQCRKISAQHGEFAMVESTKAGIEKDWLLKLLKCRVCGGRPHIANGFCILPCHNLAERQGAQLKMRDEISVKLKEPNKASHILDQFRERPMTQELVFWHGWSISIRGNVDSDELESLGKEVALFKAEGEPVGLTNVELTLHVK
jgi:hypothetical protein